MASVPTAPPSAIADATPQPNALETLDRLTQIIQALPNAKDFAPLVPVTTTVYGPHGYDMPNQTMDYFFSYHSSDKKVSYYFDYTLNQAKPGPVSMMIQDYEDPTMTPIMARAFMAAALDIPFETTQKYWNQLMANTILYDTQATRASRLYTEDFSISIEYETIYYPSLFVEITWDSLSTPIRKTQGLAPVDLGRIDLFYNLLSSQGHMPSNYGINASGDISVSFYPFPGWTLDVVLSDTTPYYLLSIKKEDLVTALNENTEFYLRTFIQSILGVDKPTALGLWDDLLFHIPYAGFSGNVSASSPVDKNATIIYYQNYVIGLFSNSDSVGLVIYGKK